MFHIPGSDGILCYIYYSFAKPEQVRDKRSHKSLKVVRYFIAGSNSSADWGTIDEEVCEDQDGHLVGLGCKKIPDVFFWSCLLFLGTFTLSYFLKMFRTYSFFPSKVCCFLK